MNEINNIGTINCTRCAHCKTTTNKYSGEWGQGVWVKNECTLHKERVTQHQWCVQFRPNVYNSNNEKPIP